MEIRNLNRNDFDQVIKLLVTSFSSRYNHPLINENLNNPNTICLVAEIDNVIIGVASLHIIEKLTRKMGLIEENRKLHAVIHKLKARIKELEG